MVTASRMQDMVQILKENNYFMAECFLYFLLLQLSLSRAPAEGPWTDNDAYTWSNSCPDNDAYNWSHGRPHAFPHGNADCNARTSADGNTDAMSDTIPHGNACHCADGHADAITHTRSNVGASA